MIGRAEARFLNLVNLHDDGFQFNWPVIFFVSLPLPLLQAAPAAAAAAVRISLSNDSGGS